MVMTVKCSLGQGETGRVSRRSAGALSTCRLSSVSSSEPAENMGRCRARVNDEDECRLIVSSLSISELGWMRTGDLRKREGRSEICRASLRAGPNHEIIKGRNLRFRTGNDINDNSYETLYTHSRVSGDLYVGSLPEFSG